MCKEIWDKLVETEGGGTQSTNFAEEKRDRLGAAIILPPFYPFRFFFFRWCRHLGQFPYSCNQTLSCNMRKVWHCPWTSNLVYYLCFWWNFPKVSAKVYYAIRANASFSQTVKCCKQWVISRWWAGKQTHGLPPFVPPYILPLIPQRPLKGYSIICLSRIPYWKLEMTERWLWTQDPL